MNKFDLKITSYSCYSKSYHTSLPRGIFMKNHRPLLIGAPFLYQLVDYTLLEQHHIYPVLAYPETASPIASGSPVFYDRLTIEAIGKIIEEQSIDSIICYNDNFIIESAKLRALFSMPGLHYPEALKFKSKSVMYDILKDHMPVPSSMLYSNEPLHILEKQLGQGEYFIKPDNLAGAEGSFHIRSPRDYSLWKETVAQKEKSYIIQKYLPYRLVHCELIVKKGKVEYIQARQYSYPNHLFLEGKIIASLPINNLTLKSKIENHAILVKDCLNFTHGVMHTEFFIDDNEALIFLETNIRQAGGAINLIHKNRAGISFETAMILLELDKDFNLNSEEDARWDICGYIPMRSGTVKDIVIPELKGEYQFDIRVKIGENHNKPTSASNAAVSFIGQATNYEDLCRDFLRLESDGMVVYR